MMVTKYRLAQMDDLDEIMTLVVNAICTMKSRGIEQWDEKYPMRMDFAEDIEKGILHIGSIEGKIAVVFALNQECDEEYADGDWAYPDLEYYVIHRLCVDPSAQNQGVGKKTMRYIEELLKAKGIAVIRLDVFSGNPYALKLYTHMGYTRVGHADWRKGRFFLMEKYIL